VGGPASTADVRARSAVSRCGGTQAPRAISVSAVETYLTCPFKYFAQYVLKLEEEREEEEVMDPKTQGQFVHAVFEAFFKTWQDRGHRGITPDNLHPAREIFAEIVEEKIKPLSDAEAALERTRLLGSTVAAGLGEVVFRMEAERPTPVGERLLEYRLHGEFEFNGPNGPKRIALKGVADRIDLLADGSFRLIDYKLSSAPGKSRALQLPIYGLCAEQRLKKPLGEAAYIAFRGAKRVTPLFSARSDRTDVLAAAQEKLIDAVEHIERGEFRRRRRTCSSAASAATAPSAARTTSAMFDADARRIASIPHRTSSSRRRPERGRRVSSSSATSTCCSQASSPTAFSRSRSRERPRPRCGSASSSG